MVSGTMCRGFESSRARFNDRGFYEIYYPLSFLFEAFHYPVWYNNDKVWEGKWMRFIKFLFVILLIFSGIAYGLYYFGTNLASDKVVDVVSAQMEESGQLHEVRQVLEQDPQVKELVVGGSVQVDRLPFTTKEEATRAVIQKVGLSNLQDIQSKVQNGLSQQDIEDIMSIVEGKLSEEEILALKVIAYNEFVK